MVRRLAVVLLLVSSSWGLSQAPQVTQIGLGAGMDCATWLREGADDEAVEQWVFGFASALAAALQAQTGADPLSRLDAPAIRSWLRGRCAIRPDESLGTAIARLVMAPQR
jgi:hypothetical protein